MKAIQLTFYLAEETSEAERERITDALLSDRATLDGLRFTLASESSVYAQIRDAEQARKFRALRQMLTEPDAKPSQDGREPSEFAEDRLFREGSNNGSSRAIGDRL